MGRGIEEALNDWRAHEVQFYHPPNRDFAMIYGGSEWNQPNWAQVEYVHSNLLEHGRDSSEDL